MKKLRFTPLSLIVVINLLVLDIWVVKYTKAAYEPQVLSASTSACPLACVSLINGKSTTTATRQETISISANGSTKNMEWSVVDGSEILFNKANYPGAKKFYFQANLSTDASDRTAYARLFDSSHGIGIQGSDMNTKSTTLTSVQSGELNPFSGDLKLRIQIRSLNGNLVTIANPRIVVVY